MLRKRLRSTTGCINCRKRHRKCDETRPICTACRRLGLQCSFDVHNSSNLVTSTVQQGARELTVYRASQTSFFAADYDLPPETAVIVDHYAERFTDFVGQPSQPNSKTRSLLDFLAFASGESMVFSAMMTLLTALMPDEWISRKNAALKFSTAAITALSKSINKVLVTNDMLVTAGLLYLASLQDDTTKLYKRTHLLGIGALIARNAYELHDRGMRLPYDRFESYLYHMVLSSSVDFSLVRSGTPINYVNDCLRYSGPGKIPFGVPSSCLSCIFRAAHLRNELLTGNIKQETLRAVQEDLETERYRSDALSKDALMLYTEATRTYCEFILHKTTGRSGMPLPREDINEALATICALPDPHHWLLWPLLILGLADVKKASLIEGSLSKQISNQRFRSAQPVLSCFKLGVRSGRGLDTLLDLEAVQDLMF